MMEAVSYGKNPHRPAMVAQLVDALVGLAPRTFVSLGPGNGEPDVPLVRVLAAARPAGIDYIPVDLNVDLVHTAAKRMADIARIPFGIVADFESSLPFIGACLRRHDVSPTLFSLIGSTLSNLDLGEARFLSELHELLDERDALLIEVASRQSGWSLKSDMRGHHVSYGAGDRQLIANGVAARTGETTTDVVRDFDARFSFHVEDGAVTGAVAIDVVDSKSGLVAVRYGRYDVERLVSWLGARGWTVDFQRTYSVPSVTLGMTALRLRKRGLAAAG
jgi:hypothetical protein